MDTGNQSPLNANRPASELRGETASAWRSILEWIKVIVIALVISLPIRFFVAEPFIVNGASMDPTFSTGQFLIVDRLSYRFNAPQRGDVIVFQYPRDPSTYFIKRIIGLPGETIDMHDGKVTISNIAHPEGIKLDETYIDPKHASHDIFHEVLGSTEYFVMGDNRLQSSDSRTWGPLDASFIIGRPIVRLLPVNAISFLPGEHKE